MQIVFFITICFVLIGCKSELEDRISVLEKSLESYEKRQDNQTAEIKARVNRIDFSSAYFTPASKGYTRVDTNSGIFLVSLNDIKPYANGFKISFRIGNLSSASYKDPTVAIRYNKAFDQNMDYLQYVNNEKEIKSQLMKELKPGSWNNIDIVVAPAKSEDIGELIFRMETDTVSLYK